MSVVPTKPTISLQGGLDPRIELFELALLELPVRVLRDKLFDLPGDMQLDALRVCFIEKVLGHLKLKVSSCHFTWIGFGDYFDVAVVWCFFFHVCLI